MICSFFTSSRAWPAACLFALSASFVAGASADVEILVEERAGIARTDEPVTLGIPFAEGEHLPGEPARLVDALGTPVGVQLAPMSLWGDGSVRWMKCDFQAQVGADAMSSYSLETGVADATSTELDVVETAERITVTTGPLRFAVSKVAFNLFDELWLDTNGDRSYSNDERLIAPGSPGPIVEASGVTVPASSTPPARAVVEEAGPMKVVIAVDGRHNDGGEDVLKYETRITAYAGHAYVKLWHVHANGKSVFNLGNALDPANGQAFDRYAIELALALEGAKSARFAGDAGAVIDRALAGGETLTLVQADRTGTAEPLAWTLEGQGGALAAGDRADGWMTVVDDRWGMTLASRYFWEKYPKGLSITDDGTVAFAPAPTPEYLYVSQGTGDEVTLHFHTAADVVGAETVARGFGKAPLLPHVAPDTYATTRAFYALHPGPSSRFPAVDAYAIAVTESHVEYQESQGFLGTLNYGAVPSYDWGFDPDEVDASGWGGNYYDATLLTPARLFAQTGDGRFADVLVPAAKHYMETVCWNTYDPESWMSGYAPAYSAYHRGSDHFEHHYAEGLWAYYYLTGDERAREVSLRAADSIVNRQAWGNENSGCRLAYQRGSACIEAFKSTRDPVYLEHAKTLLVGLILDTQDPWGMVGGYFAEAGEGVRGEQTFMMALYADALYKLIVELDADDPDRDSLVDRFALLADFLDGYARQSPGAHDYWNWWNFPPRENAEPEPYTVLGNPDSEVYWNAKGLIAGTYAYAYELTGEMRYRVLAEELVDHVFDVGPQGSDDGAYFWSKISGQLMKTLPHVVGILEDTTTPTLPGQDPTAPGASVVGLRVVSARPNPFGARVAFRVAGDGLAGGTDVALRIFDVRGRLVRTLATAATSGASATLAWDGRDSRGTDVAPGRYFYRLERGDRAPAAAPHASGSLLRLE